MSGRPVAQLSRRWTFVAAHRLHVDHLSESENRETFGKCNNPYGHGHNYVVQATFSGPVDAATGMVTNLGDLDAFARVELMERFDHKNLNELEMFRAQVSTTENLAIELWKIFKQYPHAKLERIRVEETSNNAFDYFGEGEKEAR